MTSLRQLGNVEVDYEVKGLMARDVVFRHGSEEVGKLAVKNMDGRTAQATCADGKWIFHLQGMMGTKIAISAVTAVDEKGRETTTPIGEATYKKSKWHFTKMAGQLAMADGKVYQWNLVPDGAEWVEEGTQQQVVRINATKGKGKKGIFVIAPAATAGAHTPMLPFLGLYLILIIMNQSSINTA
jgi:hypothetical protein